VARENVKASLVIYAKLPVFIRNNLLFEERDHNECAIASRSCASERQLRRTITMNEKLATQHWARPNHSGVFHLILLLVVLLTARYSLSQVDLTTIIGAPEHAHTLPVRFGFVNLDNGNLHLEIPLYSQPFRGHPTQTVALVYDSMFWNYWPLTGGPEMLYPTDSGWTSGGVTSDAPPGAFGSPSSQIACSVLGGGLSGYIYLYSEFQATDGRNTTHTFKIINQSPIADAHCYYTNGSGEDPDDNDSSVDGYPQNGTIYAQDGSGYRLTVSKSNYIQSLSVTTPSGSGGTTPNGNYWSDSSGAHDDLGSPIPSTTGIIMGSQLYPTTQSYVSDQPYSPTNPVTGSITRQVLVNGALGNTMYSLTWNYIPVCTGNSSTDYCGGMWALGSVALPDGGAYTFSYDQGASSVHLGKLTSITLPTGGIISYSYGPLECSGIFCGGQIQSVSDNGGETQFQFSAPGTVSGVGSYGAWTYYPVTVTYPSHVTVAGGTAMVQDATTYSASIDTLTKSEFSGSSTLLRTTTTTTDNYSRPVSVKAIWSSTGESHEIDYKYADDPSVSGTMTYGQLGIDMVALETEYNSGSLVRSVQTTYLKDNSTASYVSQYNMINYPSLVTLMNASSSVVSQVQYTYDEYSASYCSQHYPAGLSGIPMLSPIMGAAGHDDANHGSGFVARGNPTTISYSGVSVSSPVVVHKCYDTLGNVAQIIDGNGNATRFNYVDNFYETKCLPNEGTSPTYAFPTTVTDPLGHQTITSYYSCYRAAESVRSPNDIANGRSGTSYSYDSAFRQSCSTTPDGGE